MRNAFILITLFAFTTSVQAQFQLLAESQNETCKWYVKNISADSHKLTSVSMRFFHQGANIVFTPSITNPGGGKYQFKGNYNGDGIFNFKYKTIQILSLDANLQPGEQALLSTTENAGTVRDTIIAAGVTVYYSDFGNPNSSQVFPGGVTPCPSTPVFINAGTSNSGIKLGSLASQPLHFAVCEPQLVAIVFDNNTLKRKAVSGQTPHCEFGRKWKTWGHAEDSMIYYSFDITTTVGQLQFDTFVNAMNIGDYIALTNTLIIDLSHLNAVLNSMKKIGFGYPAFSNSTGFFTVLGKKGVNPDEAVYNHCQDDHGICNVSLEHSMTAGDKTNAMKDYSSCYENIVQYLEIAPVNSITAKEAIQMEVHPNPTTQNWQVSGKQLQGTLHLYSQTGKHLGSYQIREKAGISTDHLASGLYILSYEGYNGITKSIRLVKL